MFMTHMPVGLEAVITELVTLRKERGWSQEDLAYKCGVPRGTIANIERATHEPRRTNLRAIAKALGVDPHRWERMLDGKSVDMEGDALDLAALLDTQSPDVRQVVREWALLPQDLQAHLADVVRATLAAFAARRRP
jgi:transcriptional regulator with XRE-family HTH domain